MLNDVIVIGAEAVVLEFEQIRCHGDESAGGDFVNDRSDVIGVQIAQIDQVIVALRPVCFSKRQADVRRMLPAAAL